MKRCLRCGAIRPSDVDVCTACHDSPRMLGRFLAFAPELAASAPGFRPEHFAQLAELEAGNFWFRARNELIVDALRAYFPSMGAMLEVGCGTGFVLKGIRASFPHTALTGSEIYTEGLEFAQQRVPDAVLLQMDARHIPYQDEFDVVGAFDVVEHISEDELVLSEMHRAVRPDGGILITVPQHPSLWSVQDEIACHVRRYRRGELEDKLRRAGFRIIMSTSFVSLLLPLLAAARLRKKSHAPNHDPASELKLPRPVDALLYSVLRLERAAISAGVRFPVGGTRLVAATKS